MSVGDFLKIAAGQLRRASVVLKQEAGAMLSEKENATRQRLNTITHARIKLKAVQLLRTAPNQTDRQRQDIVKQAKGLERRIADEQQAIKYLKKEVTNSVSTKWAQAQGLESRATELEGQAGAF